MNAIADVERECGDGRDEGATYLEVGLSPFGQPLEHWIHDPVIKIDPDELGLSPRMPLLVENQETGGWNIYDWMGKSFLPNPADGLEEMRKYGLSRKCELSRDQMALLDKESEIRLVVPDAYVEPELLVHMPQSEIHAMRAMGYRWNMCPTGIHDVDTMLDECCAGWLWRRTDHKTEPHPSYDDTRYVIRKMKTFAYNAVSSHEVFKNAEPESFSPGLVISLKITRFVVIKAKDGSHKERLKELQGLAIPVEEVEM